MDEYTEDYRNGFIDGVAGVIAAIFEECDEKNAHSNLSKIEYSES